MSELLSLPAAARRRRLKPLLGAISYVQRNRQKCFICALVDGDPDYPHHVVYETSSVIAFLAKGPMHWGHTLVCPKAHREHVVNDFAEDEYAELQRSVHRVACAVSRSVPCERLYVLSLGSQQLNRHVHWHIAPLPPGVALPRQQFRSFSQYFAGVLEAPEHEWRALADRIRSEVATSGSP